MKIGLCQLHTTDDKRDNIARAGTMLKKAADRGAALAILPEMFSIAYDAKLFHSAAEEYPDGEAIAMLRETAKETGMCIIGGSIPFKENGRVYNTSLSFDETGAFIGKYSKAHLFDVEIPGVYRFKESDTIAKGDNYPLFLSNAPVKTSVMICFDIRFPEWSRVAMEQGAELIALPAAFAMATGPRHWELLMRARALDNQVFVAAVAPAQSRHSYGHSMLASPDGKVLIDCGTQECIKVVEADCAELMEMRASIPVANARRKDLYKLQTT